MARKVFLSFLGFTDYREIIYSHDISQVSRHQPLRFVQEATLELLIDQSTTPDIVYIFTTSGALINWDDNYHKVPGSEEKVFRNGLKSRLELMGLNFQNVMIPDGKNTQEIWEIFQVVYNLLAPDDDVYFDITHSFRTLPMLNMVLINYAKLLKKITISGIFYGAFEAKTKSPEGIEYAPLWNLKAFSELQDWTLAANIFLSSGEASHLSHLIKNSGKEMLANNLSYYSKIIKTTRLKEIISGQTPINIAANIDELDTNDSHMLAVLKPILQEVNAHFEAYKKDNIQNGLVAIEWCLKNGLIHQSYALMSELLITYTAFLIDFDFEDQLCRNTINGALAISNFDSFVFKEGSEEQQREILKRMNNLSNIKQLKERSKSINLGNRNDILHAGMRPSPKSPDELIEEAKTKFEKLKNVITCS